MDSNHFFSRASHLNRFIQEPSRIEIDWRKTLIWINLIWLNYSIEESLSHACLPKGHVASQV